MRTYVKDPNTGLKQKLEWYCSNYGLSLSTVRRHRRLLDHPKTLLMTLLWSRNRVKDIIGLRTLQNYVNAHCR